jgi:hypothetical protein
MSEPWEETARSGVTIAGGPIGLQEPSACERQLNANANDSNAAKLKYQWAGSFNKRAHRQARQHASGHVELPFFPASQFVTVSYCARTGGRSPQSPGDM